MAGEPESAKQRAYAMLCALNLKIDPTKVCADKQRAYAMLCTLNLKVDPTKVCAEGRNLLSIEIFGVCRQLRGVLDLNI